MAYSDYLSDSGRGGAAEPELRDDLPRPLIAPLQRRPVFSGRAFAVLEQCERSIRDPCRDHAHYL